MWRGGPGVGEERREGPAPDLGQAPFGAVDEAGQPQLVAGPGGEAVSRRDGRAEVTADPDRAPAGIQRHEGNHVECAQPRVDPLVAAQVDVPHRGPRHRPHGLLETWPRPPRRQHRPVVVAVAVHVEHDTRGPPRR